MVLSSKVSITKDWEKALELWNIQMGQSTKEILLMMRFRAKVFTSGLMEKFTMEAGNCIKWMVRASFIGNREKNTQVVSLITKNMDMEYSLNKTVSATKAIGKTVRNMEKGSS